MAWFLAFYLWVFGGYVIADILFTVGMVMIPSVKNPRAAKALVAVTWPILLPCMIIVEWLES